MDAAIEAKKIAFDRVGSGEKVLLISGFPQTRLSWNRLVPLVWQLQKSQYSTSRVPYDMKAPTIQGVWNEA